MLLRHVRKVKVKSFMIISKVVARSFTISGNLKKFNFKETVADMFMMRYVN